MTAPTMPADAAEIVRLAERIEQATDGRSHRDIEADIYTLFGGTAFWGGRRPDGRYHVRNEVPHYLSSLDAAMTLLDPVWGYEQRMASGDPSDCWVEIWWVPEFPGRAYGKGPTPALALTAAALKARARAAQHDHEVG